MGWYIVIKTIKGHRYRYRQRTWREGKHVRTESVYLGPVGGDGARSDPRKKATGITAVGAALAEQARTFASAAMFIAAVDQAHEKRAKKAFADPYLKVKYTAAEAALLAAFDEWANTPEVQARYGAEPKLKDGVLLAELYGQAKPGTIAVPERVWAGAAPADGVMDTKSVTLADMQERDIVRARNKTTGEIVEREVRSVKSDALALVEPISGIPFKYPLSKWSFAIVKKAGPLPALRFKAGDQFIDLRDGERMTITKVLADKGKYLLQGTSGADGWVTEAQLLERHSRVGEGE